MERTKAEQLIASLFGIHPDRPFERYPNILVFRHPENSKWFGVIMTIPKRKLGIPEDGNIDILNLKCAPEMLDSLWQEDGIYPAYHMNRGHWITATLDGRVTMDTLAFLLRVSFDLTLPRKKS